MEIGLAGGPLPLMSEADDRIAVRCHLEVVGQQAQGFRQSLAAGLPLRAIIISDLVPLSTASTRRERLDFASSILTTGIFRCSWLDLAKLEWVCHMVWASLFH